MNGILRDLSALAKCYLLKLYHVTSYTYPPLSVLIVQQVLLLSSTDSECLYFSVAVLGICLTGS